MVRELMGRLSRSDLEAALAFVAEAAEAASQHERADPWLLERLARLLDAELVEYGQLDAASRVLQTSVYPASIAHDERSAVPIAERNPFCDYRDRIGDPYFRAVRLSDVLGPETGRLGGAFAGWDGVSAIQMRMPGPSGTHWTLDLERDGRDFSDRDVRLVDAIRPAFIAYEAQRRLTMKISRLDAARQEAVSDRLLSTREQQVLDLVADGASNAEIAWRLRIAPGTVKKHLEHIYAKLDVGSRTAALARSGRAVPVPSDTDRRLTLD